MLRWTLFATLFGVSAAVWYVNFRPNLEFAPAPRMPAFTLDREAIPSEPLANPFLGEGTVSGIIRDALGAPLENAAIHAWAGRRTAETASDSNGYYALRDLPPGPLRLIVGVEGHRGQIKEGLFLAAGESLEMDFQLAERAVPKPDLLPVESGGAMQTVSGRCVDGNAGGTWYRVHIEPMRATDPLLRASVETESLGTGFFVFQAVPAGRYRLRVTAAGGPARDLLEFTRIDDFEVPADELTLRFAAPRLALIVRDAKSAELTLDRARVAVFWSPAESDAETARDEWLVARQRATSDGRISLLPMPHGRVRLIVSAPGYRTEEREIELHAESERDLVFALSPRS